MKAILALAALFTFTAHADNWGLPGSLSCGEKYQITGINSDRMVFGGLRGVIMPMLKDQTILLDFGIGAHGGDQDSFFTIRMDELKAYNDHKLATLPVHYDSGYYGGGGYEKEESVDLTCTGHD